jgi:glycosyltransferase involved in cell wall biosynthesis
MKIIIISASVGVIPGSQETIIYQMAEHLSKKHEVAVITGRSRQKHLLRHIQDASFEVVTVPFWARKTSFNELAVKLIPGSHPWKIESFSFYFNTLLRPFVKRMIKEADVITTWMRLESRLFSNLANRYGVPCLSNLQLTSFSKKFFEMDKSVMYIANSRFSKDSIEQEYNVDLEGFVTPGISEKFLDRNLQVNPEIKSKKSVLFVGNLRKQKGVFELINIFEKISKIYEDAVLCVIGSGDMRTRLNEKVKSLDLSDKVVFLGEVDYDDMPLYYNSATILLHPTEFESYGMVVLEAMACGLPVVASDIPALKEVGEGAALLLPLGDWDVWIKEIDKLLGDKSLRKEMSLVGKEKAKQHIWEKKGEEFEKFIKKAAQIKSKI